MEEIFKTVHGFSDYEVSNCGRVKTKSRMVRYTHSKTKKEHFRLTEHKFLKVQINNNTGYKFYQLYLNKKMYNKPIHRLVMETFVPNPLLLQYINHKDGNKHNNELSNLEWCTNEYNHEHATSTGLKAKGEAIGSSKLNESSIHAIRYLIEKKYSHSELSKMFLVSRATIMLIHKNKIWKHVALTKKELTKI